MGICFEYPSSASFLNLFSGKETYMDINMGELGVNDKYGGILGMYI